MNWAFVDYENVGSLEAVKLSDYAKIFVFCGPKNNKLKLGDIPSEGFCSIELIGVTTSGANNLDFHLAFHLGRFHEIAPAEVAFHIVSNDSGFNGLMKHLNKLGRKCQMVATRDLLPKASKPKEPRTRETKPKAAKAIAPKAAPAVPPPLSETAKFLEPRLKQLADGKRPARKDRWINWIKSQSQGFPNPAPPEAVYAELVSARLIGASAQK